MSHRQLADQEGHRWDVEDQGPLKDPEGPEGDETPHQLRFIRDDGDERIREAPSALDRMADTELRSLLEAGGVGETPRGPDLEANRSGGYGDTRE